MTLRRIPLLLTAVALAVLAAVPAGAETAVIDATMSLGVGDSDSYTSSTVPGGVNTLYFEQAPGVGGAESCTKDADTYCEHVLVDVTNPGPEDDPDGELRRSLRVDLSTDAADYDMFVFESDADGTVGAELGRSTAFPIGDFGESVNASITTTVDTPTRYALVRVVFFAPSTPMTLDVRF